VIEIADIEAAHRRIAPWVRQTPVMALTQLKTPMPGTARVILKLECLQVTGSFKARGAMNRLLVTPKERIVRGIVTASGGNHGLAVARAADAAGVPGVVYVPSTVSPAKVARMKVWNARVVVVDGEWERANALALEHAERSGALHIHPFADPAVVAGQGSLGLEILDQLPELDAILIAVGGGGLIAGLATAIRAKRPTVRIIGVEPDGSPTLRACLDAGRCIALPAVTTKVATMACRQTDERIFDIVRRTVDDIVLVSDDEMVATSRWLWFEMAVAADLSGAACLAALRRGLPGLATATQICALVCGAGPEGTT